MLLAIARDIVCHRAPGCLRRACSGESHIEGLKNQSCSYGPGRGWAECVKWVCRTCGSSYSENTGQCRVTVHQAEALLSDTGPEHTAAAGGV